MDHYPHHEFDAAAEKHLAAEHHDLARATVRTSGVFIRENGTFFSTPMHPKSVSAKKKHDVVAVIHPELGFSG